MYVSYRTQTDVLEEQLLFRRCRVGNEAARDIARRVEAAHGFWDFEERKRAHEAQTATSVETISVVRAGMHDGAPLHCLAGLRTGKDSPELAA